MNVKVLLGTIGMLLAFSGCGNSQDEVPAINQLTDHNIAPGQRDSIYNLVRDFPHNTQLSIALIRDGQVAYYGTLHSNDTLHTIENSSKVFEIGSITKVFTTTLLASFVLGNEVHPDSSVNTCFDFPFKDNHAITFKELANHTSGLPRLPSNMGLQAIMNPKNPYKGYDQQKLDEYLQNDMSMDYPGGTKSVYSNLGMGLLSYALQKRSGKDFEQLARERIFDKYGMVNSTILKDKIEGLLIGGLDAGGKPTPNWEPGALVGMGGMYSTVADLSKFALAHFDSTNLELALTRVKTFQENEYSDVGLGWFILNRKIGKTWYWHNGGTGGYTTSMAIDVENKSGVIILSNVSAYHKHSGNVDRLCFSLMEML